MQELLFQEPGEVTNSNLPEATTRCQLVLKFFDYLEANADSYWDVPRFELGNGTKSREEAPGNWVETQLGDDEANGEDGLFSAAYEDVVYRDSTDDGVDGQIFDSSDSSEDELEVTGQAISDRLVFLQGPTVIQAPPFKRHIAGPTVPLNRNGHQLAWMQLFGKILDPK